MPRKPPVEPASGAVRGTPLSQRRKHLIWDWNWTEYARAAVGRSRKGGSISSEIEIALISWLSPSTSKSQRRKHLIWDWNTPIGVLIYFVNKSQRRKHLIWDWNNAYVGTTDTDVLVAKAEASHLRLKFNSICMLVFPQRVAKAEASHLRLKFWLHHARRCDRSSRKGGSISSEIEILPPRTRIWC